MSQIIQIDGRRTVQVELFRTLRAAKAALPEGGRLFYWSDFVVVAGPGDAAMITVIDRDWEYFVPVDPGMYLQEAEPETETAELADD